MKIKHLTESESKQLEPETFNKLLETDYSQAYEQYMKGNVVYKGMTNLNNDKPILLEPKLDRKSQNTSNFYTLWINNHPDWKQFPNRNVICTTHKRYANNYGDVFIIFPKNNTDIGIVPTPDIWDSFEFDEEDLEVTFDGFLDLFQTISKEKLLNLDSYKQLLTLINNFDSLEKEERFHMLSHVYLSDNETKYILNNSLYKFFQQQFTPEGFNLQNISNLALDSYQNNECWFDNTFIAIPEDIIQNLI